MTRNQLISGSLIAAAVAALTFGAGSAWAQAEQAYAPDPNAAQNWNESGIDFRLTPQTDTEVLNYTHPRAVRICNLTGRYSPGTRPVPADQSVPSDQSEPLSNRPVGATTSPTPVNLTVTYDGKTTQVRPGECDRMQAQNLRLSPTEPLPDGSALNGTIEMEGVSAQGYAPWEHGYHPAGYSRQNAETTQQLITELRQDDQLMRQSNAELQQARDQLIQARKALESAQYDESRAAQAAQHTREATTDNAANNGGSQR